MGELALHNIVSYILNTHNNLHGAISFNHNCSPLKRFLFSFDKTFSSFGNHPTLPFKFTPERRTV